MNNSSKLPLVAVSACLLGQQVRYDGKDKYTPIIAEELNKSCRLIAVCPELEIGLGVPRKKIQLTQIDDQIRVLKIDNSDDVSELLVSFAEQFINKYDLAGLVLQDRSPSCGMGNTKLYSQDGKIIGMDSGLFAASIIKKFPELPVICVSQLQSKQDVLQFLGKLKN